MIQVFCLQCYQVSFIFTFIQSRPGYSAQNSDNDIAILKLSTPINFVPDVAAPACLPKGGFAPDEDGVTAIARYHSFIAK